MPPHVSNGGPISPSVEFSNGAGLCSSPKNGGTARRMKFHGKKLLPVLVLILSCLSILRLLKIAMITSHSSSPDSILSSSFQSNAPSTVDIETGNATLLTLKEFMVLSKIVTRKAPCNLLVFGLQSQYVDLSSINAGGITVFLEDDPRKIREIKAGFNGTRVYNVKYQTPAKKAYGLLKHARGNPACSPATNLMNQSSCKLALRNLYGTSWWWTGRPGTHRKHQEGCQQSTPPACWREVVGLGSSQRRQPMLWSMMFIEQLKSGFLGNSCVNKI